MIGSDAAAASAVNWMPRRASPSNAGSADSSSKVRMQSPANPAENCSTMQRSGTVVPGGTSVSQLCGRSGPVMTRLPGPKRPM